MSLSRVTVLAAIAAAAIGGALACGPDFPWQLLSARQETMTEPVWLDFSYDAARLAAPPRDGLRAVERPDEATGTVTESVLTERQEAQSGEWQALATDLPASRRTPETFLALLQAARDSVDGAAAAAAGAGLPVAVRLYVAGAVDFQASRFDVALRYFDAIDGLPAEQRQVRAVAAAYMKGRIHQANGDAEAARLAFRAARAAAESGAPDPMGLAVASYGEEARVDLVEAGLITSVPWPIEGTDDAAKVTSLIAESVRLYAEQVARDSRIGFSSLRMVAPMIIGEPELLDRLIADTTVRRLVVAYAVARLDGLWETDLSTDDVVARVLEAALKLPAPTGGEEIDRLALLAYHAGRYDVAERLSARTDRPLGLWVRAKLALRRGDRPAAVRDWTAAFAASQKPGAADDLDEGTRVRLRGETSVARLSAGDYRDSLALLFPAAGTYWGDVAYIAERILTVDELKAFVDGLPPPGPKSRKAASADDSDPPAVDPVERLRSLLARRLVRDGRNAEAIAYFPASLQRWSDDPAQRDLALEDAARRYADAVAAARPGWRWHDVTRAEALFKVATLTRTLGMELMGTEGPPDLAAVDGNYTYGYGQESPRGTVESKTAELLLGPDEAKRFADSAPKPDKRFHYRVIATDRALEAADLLPTGSQAYAATLCWATRYAFASNDAARAEQIYRRYVATGPYQAWATRFGRVCPQPDFDAARDYWPKRIMRLARQHTGLAVAAALGVALLLAAAVLFVRRRQSAALQAKLAASSGLPVPE
jgi:tetratricopeptide (TPR) repeat protein